MMYYRDYAQKYGIDESTLDDYQKRGMVNKYKASSNRAGFLRILRYSHEFAVLFVGTFDRSRENVKTAAGRT